MPLQKIAIISILKPVDDVRSYHKFSRTLSINPNYRIHLFGYPSSGMLENADNIRFYAHDHFNRLSVSRFLVRIKIYWQLIKLKPQLIIVNTAELLIVAILNKILFGTKICYDIQENYYYNLKYQQVYPPIFKSLLAFFVRSKERALSPFYDHFLLAENCYSQELQFVKNRYTIIENKALVSHDHSKPDDASEKMQLLFSGTISDNTGVRAGIQLYRFLFAQNQNVSLTIIGHCPDAKLKKEIESLGNDHIDAKLSDFPVPHEWIVDAISKADFGIVSYQPNKSNRHCMPTKVYEYAALGLPCIYQMGAHWESFIIANKCGLGVNFENLGAPALYDLLTTFKESYHQKPIESAIWKEEGQKLIQVVDMLINE